MTIENNIKLPGWLTILAASSIVIAIIAIAGYLSVFGIELSTNQEVWGQFGDYIGGILNPLFALTALFALLHTIILQSRELRNSSEQLAKSANALQKQNAVLEKQNFEATFFQLLRLYNDIVKELYITVEEPGPMGGILVDSSGEKVKHEERQCIEELHKILLYKYFSKVERGDFTSNTEEAIKKSYSKFYLDYGSYLGHYFKTIYHIIKFVDKSSIPENKKRIYTNLLRAQLSKYELGLLLYNCSSIYGKEKLLPLVKKYDILKHVEKEILANKAHLNLIT